MLWRFCTSSRTGRDLRINSDGGERHVEAGPDEHRVVEERRHGVVHQRVSLDEVQVRVVQLLAVVRARPCKDLKYEENVQPNVITALGLTTQL